MERTEERSKSRTDVGAHLRPEVGAVMCSATFASYAEFWTLPRATARSFGAPCACSSPPRIVS
jgi:hypothetical protein